MSKTTLKLRDSDYMTQIFDPQAGTFSLFYGIEGITMLYHGAWADPEVEYNGIHSNYHHLEDYLWDLYEGRCDDEGRSTSDEEFQQWVKENADEAYAWFEEYKESRYCGDFFGVEGVKMYDYALYMAQSNEDRDWDRVRVEYNGVSTEYNDLLEWLYICISNDTDAPVVIDDEEYAKYAKANPDEVLGYFTSLSKAA